MTTSSRRFTSSHSSRRSFLQAGVLAGTGWTLTDLLQARATNASERLSSDPSGVVWLWLGGGPTHIETFDPKLTAPSEIRSVTGEVQTSVGGVSLGGQFGGLARQFEKLAIVRSFAHDNSGHAGGTHYVMTGYDNRAIDNGGLPTRPGVGSIIAKARGASSLRTGLPTYCRLSSIGSDGPAFLGPASAPFDPDGQTRRNLQLELSRERLGTRHELLGDLDRLRADIDETGAMEGVDAYTAQAFQLMLGKATEAFDVELEDEATRQRYGNSELARRLLTARRLIEGGCSFVTINDAGWDMHRNLKRELGQKAPVLDHAVSAFLEDVWSRGLEKRILLVITGEFGRTPRLNRAGGRDHWAPLSTLALAGGDFRLGQVIGESQPKADAPKTRPIRPQDLLATVLHHLGINPKIQFPTQGGRPVSMIETGEPITELL